MCFPVNFTKFFKNIFLVKHLETPTSVSTVSMQRLYVIDCVLKFRSRGPDLRSRLNMILVLLSVIWQYVCAEASETSDVVV